MIITWRTKEKSNGKVIPISQRIYKPLSQRKQPLSNITTRVLEECGEVASEVNHFEKSGIKSLKHGEPSKQHLADEIKQAINALVQLAVYYNVETEFEESIDRSLAKMKNENLL